MGRHLQRGYGQFSITTPPFPVLNSLIWCLGLEKEAKKEGFRKYLEVSGVLDALTKVLVALYEQNDKPSSALEFVQQKLGGPSLPEYEKLQAELSDLQIRYNELLKENQERCRELEELKHTQVEASATKELDVGNTRDEELKSADVVKS
ncbi:C-Myc-binding protein [Capsicum annuum]|uniref:c-Myc-binding protein n=1 Tax=Capsicum annuum TaxID=4072 RepID=A0A2G2ZG81_CAPAN|nr:C-Myc-binding protein [Capsicum annuum]